MLVAYQYIVNPIATNISKEIPPLQKKKAVQKLQYSSPLEFYRIHPSKCCADQHIGPYNLTHIITHIIKFTSKTLVI